MGDNDLPRETTAEEPRRRQADFKPSTVEVISEMYQATLGEVTKAHSKDLKLMADQIGGMRSDIGDVRSDMAAGLAGVQKGMNDLGVKASKSLFWGTAIGLFVFSILQAAPGIYKIVSSISIGGASVSLSTQSVP